MVILHGLSLVCLHWSSVNNLDTTETAEDSSSGSPAASPVLHWPNLEMPSGELYLRECKEGKWTMNNCIWTFYSFFLKLEPSILSTSCPPNSTSSVLFVPHDSFPSQLASDTCTSWLLSPHTTASRTSKPINKNKRARDFFRLFLSVLIPTYETCDVYEVVVWFSECWCSWSAESSFFFGSIPGCSRKQK